MVENPNLYDAKQLAIFYKCGKGVELGPLITDKTENEFHVKRSNHVNILASESDLPH